MKSRMMKLISIIACGSAIGLSSLLTWQLWQMAEHTGSHRMISQGFLAVGLALIICGALFCTVQAWRLFSIINLEATYHVQTLAVLNWLKRGTLVVTAGLLIDWWPIYAVADHADAPGMILAIVILTILIGSIAVLAAIFQDVLITSHILSQEPITKKSDS